MKKLFLEKKKFLLKNGEKSIIINAARYYFVLYKNQKKINKKLKRVLF